MSRQPRIVLPGLPHHVTQRGTRRQPTFFADADYRSYLALLRDKSQEHGVAIDVYCLMPNHVHHCATPSTGASFELAFGQCHSRHAYRVNSRQGWRGHLWQERFYSCPMDERHAQVAARYVLLNPVRAGLVRRAEDWPYSSARYALGIVDHDPLVADRRFSPDEWSQLLSTPPLDRERRMLRRQTRAGLPFGEETFVSFVEERVGRRLRPRRRGRPPKAASRDE